MKEKTIKGSNYTYYINYSWFYFSIVCFQRVNRLIYSYDYFMPFTFCIGIRKDETRLNTRVFKLAVGIYKGISEGDSVWHGVSISLRKVWVQVPLPLPSLRSA